MRVLALSFLLSAGSVEARVRLIDFIFHYSRLRVPGELKAFPVERFMKSVNESLELLGGGEIPSPERFRAIVAALDGRHREELLALLGGDVGRMDRGDFTRFVNRLAYMANRSGGLACGECVAGRAYLTAKEGFLSAAEKNQPHLVRLALESGVDVNVKDRLGDTGLMLAARNFNHSVVGLLVEAGADLNVQSRRAVFILPPELWGLNPALYLTRGMTRTRRALIKAHGLDLYAASENTALMMAVVNKDLETVRMLVEAGADRTLGNSKGQSALDIAGFLLKGCDHGNLCQTLLAIEALL